MNELTIREVTTEFQSGSACVPEFFVDGQSLHQHFKIDNPSDRFEFGLVSELGLREPFLSDFVLELRGEKTPKNLFGSRLMLYICACSDESCGSIHCEVLPNEKTIVWNDVCLHSEDGDRQFQTIDFEFCITRYEREITGFHNK